jgi:hypothetical protein
MFLRHNHPHVCFHDSVDGRNRLLLLNLYVTAEMFSDENLILIYIVFVAQQL